VFQRISKSSQNSSKRKASKFNRRIQEYRDEHNLISLTDLLKSLTDVDDSGDFVSEMTIADLLIDMNAQVLGVKISVNRKAARAIALLRRARNYIQDNNITPRFYLQALFFYAMSHPGTYEEGITVKDIGNKKAHERIEWYQNHVKRMNNHITVTSATSDMEYSTRQNHIIGTEIELGMTIRDHIASGIPFDKTVIINENCSIMEPAWYVFEEDTFDAVLPKGVLNKDALGYVSYLVLSLKLPQFRCNLEREKKRARVLATISFLKSNGFMSPENVHIPKDTELLSDWFEYWSAVVSSCVGKATPRKPGSTRRKLREDEPIDQTQQVFKVLTGKDRYALF